MSDSPDPSAPGPELPDPPSADAAPDGPADDAPDDALEDAPTDAPDEPECAPDDGHGFGPVPLRYRYDGWVPDRQIEFIERLADCGCVDEAARAVGMSRNSAYALRRRPDAQAFRLAWDAAMDQAVARLRDAAMSRAINGVPVPVFHGGALIGERRHFDERLTMFLLRYHDPVRYGRWRDRVETHQHQDGPAWILFYRIMRLMRAASAAFDAAWLGEKQPEPKAETVFEDPGSGIDRDRGWY